jgi:uncharacterized protein (TIGR03000 family)
VKTLSSYLALATLAALLIPANANAQFFGTGSPFGFGVGGWGGWPYGGYGGWPYGGYGGWPYGGFMSGPQYFYSGAYVPPIVYTVSTPAADLAPRMRPAVWPAIAFRDAPVQGGKAFIDVRVPTATAQVWFDGVLMRQSGVERHFVTPPLTPGEMYAFEIRASWRDVAGKELTRTRRVDVRAGEQQVVDFFAP